MFTSIIRNHFQWTPIVVALCNTFWTWNTLIHSLNIFYLHVLQSQMQLYFLILHFPIVLQYLLPYSICIILNVNLLRFFKRKTTMNMHLNYYFDYYKIKYWTHFNKFILHIYSCQLPIPLKNKSKTISQLPTYIAFSILDTNMTADFNI